MSPTKTNASADATATANPKRVALAASVGATIEWYDFFLYGTAAGLVFDKLYFNGLSGTAATFASFGTFAVGFLARPVGGLIFGHFGDRIGRKTMLIWTLVIMGVGTSLVGLLPTYDSIGVLAPIALVVLRVLQGIGVGGEYGGAVLLATEYAPAGRRGLYGSFAHIGVPGGLVLASGAFALASQLPDAAFLAWGWRVCFLISIVLLAIGAWIRLSIMETPAFQEVQEEKKVSKLPVGELFRRQPRTLLLGMGTRFVEGFTYNLYSVFLLSYAVADAGLSRSVVLNAIMAGALLGVFMTVLSGALSDRFGRRPVYTVGAVLGLVIAFPVAAAVQSGAVVPSVAAFIGGLGLVYGTVYGPLAAFWSELFDTRYRFSALNALYQISGVVASGLTPLIAAALVAFSDDRSLWWVAGYNVVVAVISLTCMWLLPETRGERLRDTAVDEARAVPANSVVAR
jgi:MFS family permease